MDQVVFWTARGSLRSRRVESYHVVRCARSAQLRARGAVALALLVVGLAACGQPLLSERADPEDAAAPRAEGGADPYESPADADRPVAPGAATPADDAQPDAGPSADGRDHAPGPEACTSCAAARWDLCAELARRAGSPPPSRTQISLSSLLCELVDLDRFTHEPPAKFVAHMASSHDRASIVDALSSWFANKDYSNYVRDDGAEHVMMESFGPGAITRLWSPNPSGELRIYIDGQREPVLRAPMSQLLSGQYAAPFQEPFTFYSAHADNAYFPIPYSRHARVTTTTNEPLFYQINYREYEPATRVEPYSAASVRAAAPFAGEIAKWLLAPKDVASVGELESRELHLDDERPDDAVLLGPAVVRELSLREIRTNDDWMRRTRIIVSVDGERTIDAPIGDLFGTGPGFTPYESLPVSVSADGLSLRWPMPVKRELRVRLESNGGSLGDVVFSLRYSRGVPEDYRLFHAAWTGPRTFDTAKPFEWTLLNYQGSGWYVGTMLNVANPVEEWWGEGDEKIFVDGETFPSLFGTGTEDYFGFGWCSSDLFARPWIGQTRADGPFNWARSSSYRWHVIDAIPFTSDLRFDLEVLHWNDSGPVALTQDALTFWYAAPGGALVSQPAELSDYRVPALGVSEDPWPFRYDCGIYF